MTNVDVTCLCDKARCSIRLKATLPIDNTACHQSLCRYNLGGLYHSVIPIKERPATIDVLKDFRVDAELTRYFCGTCGSHLFEYCDDVWWVQSGAIDKIHNEQVFHALERIVGNRSVHDTRDGGFAACLKGESASNQPTHADDPGLAARSGSRLHQDASDTPTEDISPKLWGKCACGGIQYYIERPNDESLQYSSPWPDLVRPYRSQSDENPTDVKWWINKDKFFAGVCSCRSCRLGLGCPIQAWTFVSKVNIYQADGSPLSYDMGTLKSFQSSADAMRDFCGVCGATVFWRSIERRPGVIDVSVGLLRAQEGVLAKSWLSWWTNRVSFAEEALDKALIGGIESRLHVLGDDCKPSWSD